MNKTATTTMEPGSPEALLAIVEPQWQDLVTEYHRLQAEEATLHSEALEQSEQALRGVPIDLERRKENTVARQQTDTKLYATRAAMDTLEARVRSLRSAVVEVTPAEQLQAACVAAQAELDRLTAENESAVQAREAALESGTADELLIAERRLRRLPELLKAAQREVLETELSMLNGARSGTGREEWDAGQLVQAASKKLAAAQAEYNSALEAAREPARKRAYLAAKSEQLRAQIAGMA